MTMAMDADTVFGVLSDLMDKKTASMERSVEKSIQLVGERITESSNVTTGRINELRQDISTNRAELAAHRAETQVAMKSLVSREELDDFKNESRKNIRTLFHMAWSLVVGSLGSLAVSVWNYILNHSVSKP